MTAPAAFAGRPLAEADHGVVLEWFGEPDFFYRTAEPDTRPEWQVLDLLGEDTQLLLAGGEPVGLYAIEDGAAEHSSHLVLRLRLSARFPAAWWAPAYRAIVDGLRWRREVVRLALLIGDYDRAGLDFARGLGLTEEGTLTGIVRHGGGRHGVTFFSEIWEPAS